MEQVYTPRINTPAIAGWCLKYIDDAGDAPNRTATARYSWEIERNAGKVKTTTIPENVWLVGWLDFTAGMYTTYGHVFFIKRNGNNYQIYDSEVQSGSRVIIQNGKLVNLGYYKSIEELLAWFGAYSPKYLGWSTHCDGREYAKIKEDIVKPTRNQVIDTFNTYLLKGPVDQKQIDYYMQRDIRELYADVLGSTKPSQEEVNKVFSTFLPGTTDKNRVPYYTGRISKQLYSDVLGAVDKKLKEAENSKDSEYELATVYVKKRK